MKTTLLLLVTLLPVMANARLNETLDQCKARYGEPIQINKEDGLAVFEKAGIRVQAHFFNGKVDRIEFNRADGGTMDAADALVLVKANMGKDCFAVDEDHNPKHEEFSLFKGGVDFELTAEVPVTLAGVLCYTKEHQANLEAEDNARNKSQMQKSASKLKGF